MIKKRLLLIGLLLALSIIGQVVLRPCLGGDKALAPDQTADSNLVSNWNMMQDTAPKGLAPETGFAGKFVMMLAIIAIIGLAGWFWVKKMNVPWVAGRNRHLALIESMPLGPRRAVYLIRAGSKRLLVGGGPEGLRLISEVGELIMPEGAEKQ